VPLLPFLVVAILSLKSFALGSLVVLSINLLAAVAFLSLFIAAFVLSGGQIKILGLEGKDEETS
jgi:hypothetical protein